MRQNRRSKKLGELIMCSLARMFILQKDDILLRQVNITFVEVSVDMSIAKVFFGLIDDEKAGETLKMLKRESWRFRKMLAEQLNLRITPTLMFVLDDSAKKMAKISCILDTIKTDTDEDGR